MSTSASTGSAVGNAVLHELLVEHAAAQSHSLALLDDLDHDQVAWRPHEHSSSIAWHLGHQGAVNHYMVRNLTAAEVTFKAAFDRVFDSATPEPARGDLPPLDEIIGYREAIANSTRSVVERIARGDVGAPAQLALIARRLLVAVIDHEYQHARWIDEVRSTMVDAPSPTPASGRLVQVDGYWMLDMA